MKFLTIIFFLNCHVLFSQKDSLLIDRELNLEIYLNNLRKSKSDKERFENNKIFKSYLAETFDFDGVFDYPFSKLKSLGTIKSDDEVLRFFNWNIEMDDHSQKYYCYILKKDFKKKKNIVIELVDNSFMLPARPDGVLDSKNWYGALYYKIIPIEKGNKTMYTVLGMDANNSMSNIKIIDVLYFTNNNVRLGSPIFKTNDGTEKRIFFEYSKKAYMSLKFEAEYNRIIYDHLSPETPSMTGFYSYYVPDFSYDAFVLHKNKWILQEAVVGINKKSGEKLQVFVQNKKTGELEMKEIDNKWIDPSDKKAANGGNIHVARTPDMDEIQNKKFKFNLDFIKNRKGWKSRKAPESYSNYPYNK
jgi:hypothetical protein